MHQSLDISSYVLMDTNYNPEQLLATIVGNTGNVYDPNIPSIRLLLVAIHIAKGHALFELRLNTANLIPQSLSIAVPICINMH
ncbi:MAG: hypothetical protein JWR26_46 [Pedosphaera sp.]|nr:hypothetical protein [Pedosphaera sp.]